MTDFVIPRLPSNLGPLLRIQPEGEDVDMEQIVTDNNQDCGNTLGQLKTGDDVDMKEETVIKKPLKDVVREEAQQLMKECLYSGSQYDSNYEIFLTENVDDDRFD